MRLNASYVVTFKEERINCADVGSIPKPYIWITWSHFFSSSFSYVIVAFVDETLKRRAHFSYIERNNGFRHKLLPYIWP